MPKAQPKPAAPDAAGAIALAAEIDELGALEKEFAPLKAKIARIEQLRAAIRARFDAAPALEPKQLDGSRFILQLGKRGNVSTINMAKLFKAVGAKLFVAIASTTLKALETNVSCVVVASVVTVDATGPRSIKTFEKGAAA